MPSSMVRREDRAKWGRMSDRIANDADAPITAVLRDHIKAEKVKLPPALFERSTRSIVIHGLIPFAYLAASVVLARLAPQISVWSVVLQFGLLLAAHRAFQTQVHDLSHRLFSESPKRNDFWGNLLAAGWTGTHIQSYRAVHFQHHAHNGSVRDPEHISVEIVRSNGGLALHVLRYVLGLHTLRLFKKYYAPGKPRSGDVAGSSAPRQGLLARQLRTKWPVLFAQGCLVMIFVFLAGAPWLYLIWCYLAVSWSPMLSGLRFMVEHPGETDATITTYASPLERVFFAPLQFNYHFEHHVWPALPPYRLPEAHAYLCEQGYYARHPATRGDGYARPLLHALRPQRAASTSANS